MKKKNIRSEMEAMLNVLLSVAASTSVSLSSHLSTLTTDRLLRKRIRGETSKTFPGRTRRQGNSRRQTQQLGDCSKSTRHSAPTLFQYSQSNAQLTREGAPLCLLPNPAAPRLPDRSIKGNSNIIHHFEDCHEPHKVDLI